MTAAPLLYEPLRFIAIEGPLRVGKTTLADLVAKRLGAGRLCDVEDNPFLERFYHGDAGAAFQTQLYFLWERFKQWQSLDFTATASRMIVSDYLFAEQVPIPDLVIYLQAKTGMLRQRIERKRDPT